MEMNGRHTVVSVDELGAERQNRGGGGGGGGRGGGRGGGEWGGWGGGGGGVGLGGGVPPWQGSEIVIVANPDHAGDLQGRLPAPKKDLARGKCEA